MTDSVYSLKELNNVGMRAFRFTCVSSEAAARLKQLELESSPLLATPRNNVNVNVAMNNQVSVCLCNISTKDKTNESLTEI